PTTARWSRRSTWTGSRPPARPTTATSAAAARPSTPAPKPTRSPSEEQPRERRPAVVLGEHARRARPGRPGAPPRAGPGAERAGVRDRVGRADRLRRRAAAGLVLGPEGPPARRPLPGHPGRARLLRGEGDPRARRPGRLRRPDTL